MRPIRVGIIGAGNMGKAHALAYEQNGARCRLVAAADVDRSRAERFAGDFGIEPEADVASLLARDDIDAVSVCTIEGTHRPIVESAAHAGKQILLEKPIAVRLEDADAMIRAVKSAGIKFMVCQSKRFDARCAQARQAIRDGKVGKVISLSARMQGVPSQQDRIKDMALSVMVFRGVHAFDMLRWMAGSEVVRVYSEAVAGTLRARGYGSEDTTFTLLRFAAGAIGCIEVGSMCPPTHPGKGQSTIHVIGTKGIITVDLGGAFYEIVNEDSAAIIGAGRIWFRDEIAAFLECIESDSPPAVSGEEARAALVIALAAVESARTGRPVDL